MSTTFFWKTPSFFEIFPWDYLTLSSSQTIICSKGVLCTQFTVSTKERTILMKTVIATLIVALSSSVANAGGWVMIEHPMYMQRDCYNCTVTYYRGGWYTTLPDIPCLLNRTTRGIKRGADHIGHGLHNHLCPCSNNYILRPRPAWTQYSIFHTRRWRTRVTH